MSQRDFCPINEIDWSEQLYGRIKRAGDNEPDPEGELLGIDLLVKWHTEMYPDSGTRASMERLLRDWWQAREERGG